MIINFVGNTMKDLFQRVFFSLKKWCKRIIRLERRRNKAYFAYDETRFWQYAGCNVNSRESLRAGITVSYHIIEKGLTMPNRRLGFGERVVTELMIMIDNYVQKYHEIDGQVEYAIAVIKAYRKLHKDLQFDFGERHLYWQKVNDFAEKYESIPCATELHFSRSEFYKDRCAQFPDFARSRHCVRNYSLTQPLSREKIRKAIDLTRTTPSACNRQHGRVYCVDKKATIHKILSLQGGNRGFGHLADKLLIVTASLEDVTLRRERHDVYVNGGMFLMNLCYALHYYEIAHCILTWGQEPTKDQLLRKLVGINPADEVIAILSCGEMPDEADVAMSPRKDISEIFQEL